MYKIEKVSLMIVPTPPRYLPKRTSEYLRYISKFS